MCRVHRPISLNKLFFRLMLHIIFCLTSNFVILFYSLIGLNVALISEIKKIAVIVCQWDLLLKIKLNFGYFCPIFFIATILFMLNHHENHVLSGNLVFLVKSAKGFLSYDRTSNGNDYFIYREPPNKMCFEFSVYQELKTILF